MAVIDVTPQGLVLVEVGPDTTVEEVVRATGAPLDTSNVQTMKVETSP